MINTLGVGEAATGIQAVGSLGTAIVLAGACALGVAAEGLMAPYEHELAYSVAAATSAAAGTLTTGITLAGTAYVTAAAGGLILGGYVDFVEDPTGRGYDGGVVTITGTDFGPTEGVVRIDGVPQTILYWSSTTIQFVVDADAVGQYVLTVDRAA